MDLLKWLSDRWRSEAAHYPYWRLPAAQPNIQAKSGENYFQLTLSEMFLEDDRNWFAEWQPAAYVSVRFSFGDKEETVNHLAGASALKDINAAHLNEGVALNYSITPLVPYNGGEIEIAAGLLAVKGEDDVKLLLKVLGDFSRILAVPQLSTALSLAAPLADGVAELMRSTSNRPVLRFHDTFTAAGNPLEPMHLVVVSDPAGRLDQSQISIEGGRLRYGGTPLTGYNYLLFRIDTPTERDDWDSLSSIQEPYEAAVEMLQSALTNPDPELSKNMLIEADRRLGAAKLAAFRAKELTKVVGRNQVIKALQDRYADAKKNLAPGAAEQPEIPRTLTQVMASRISVEDARRLGEMSEEDLINVAP